MLDHLGNPHHARTPAGGSSAYLPEPQNHPWHAAPLPYHGGFPTTVNPDLVYEPRCATAGDTTSYRADATPLPVYPWRMHSDVLKQMIRCLTLQVDSEVVEVRKERCGPNRSKVTIVLETPEI